MSNMFSGCSGLRDLRITSLNTSNVTDMSNMFNGCSRLDDLVLDNFDTTSVKDNYGINGMFDGCTNLRRLTLSSSFFNSSGVTEFDFSGLTAWTDSSSLGEFANAISEKRAYNKTVRLSSATKNALTYEQRSKITSSGWTIA